MPLDEKDLAKKIREEHHLLQQEIKLVKEKLKEETLDEQFPEWRLDLLWLLRDFNNDLQKHFDLEEEGGFMNEVLKVAPQHGPSVQKLETEHRIIVGNLEEILADLKVITSSDKLLMKNLRIRINDLLLMVSNHEAAEGDLLMSTYLQDEGGGD